MPWAAGVTPKRRSTSPSGSGSSTTHPTGTAVEDGEQAAAPGEQAPDGVDVLAERVGRRVEGGPGTEGLLHDREDVGGRLGVPPGVRRRSQQALALGERR